MYDYEPDRRMPTSPTVSSFFCGIARRQDDCVGENDRWQTDAPEGTFVTVASAGAHSCAVRTEGTIACWGSNSVGQSDVP